MLTADAQRIKEAQTVQAPKPVEEETEQASLVKNKLARRGRKPKTTTENN